MDIPLDLSPYFGGPLVRLDSFRVKQIFDQNIKNAINKMGELSAKAASLCNPLTSCEKLIDSPGQILYLMWDKGEKENTSRLIGHLKIGYKSLFVLDRHCRHLQGRTLCVLDFYIHHSLQRGGLGKKLFEYMLQNEGGVPEAVALDSPPVTLLSFMAKNYGLVDPIWQNTNFVVYPQFFDLLYDKTDNPKKAIQLDNERPGTPHKTHTGNMCENETRPGENPTSSTNSTVVGDLSTEGAMAYRTSAAKQRKANLLSSHWAIGFNQ